MTADLKTLSERLVLVEKEVASIREEMTGLVHATTDSQAARKENLLRFRTDKDLQRRLMACFLAEFGIEGRPIEAEELQRRMAKSGLEPNELSISIIEAREE